VNEDEGNVFGAFVIELSNIENAVFAANGLEANVVIVTFTVVPVLLHYTALVYVLLAHVSVPLGSPISGGNVNYTISPFRMAIGAVTCTLY
jgi:hypothetical protein